MVHRLFRMAHSRHPLARAAIAVLGVIVVVLFVTVGVFALAVLIVGGALLLLVNALRSKPGSPRPVPANTPDVIEGEFKVVSATPAPRDRSSEPR